MFKAIAEISIAVERIPLLIRETLELSVPPLFRVIEMKSNNGLQIKAAHNKSSSEVPLVFFILIFEQEHRPRFHLHRRFQ